MQNQQGTASWYVTVIKISNIGLGGILGLELLLGLLYLLVIQRRLFYTAAGRRIREIKKVALLVPRPGARRSR